MWRSIKNMGLIGDKTNVWSRSGSGSGSFVDNVLDIAEQVTDTINLIANLIAGAKERKLVISDYRKASVHLPKYYKVENYEVVATIGVIDTVGASSVSGREKSGNEFVNDLWKRERKDTFILKNVQESFSERSQIVETFGEDFAVFFTGEAPKIFTFNGTLINDAYRMWKSNIVAAYSELLRGSKLAQNKLKVEIVYDYVVVEGYILNLVCQTESEDDVNVPFSFNLLVTRYEDIGIDIFSEEPIYGGQLGWPLDSSALS
ncbi:MAG: hypothetical protein QG552_2753, partial [Thermodesulfobacteriota bacterium]|nr:hypothetical protein [Thermodesulfobacteriota bacterium]